MKFVPVVSLIMVGLIFAIVIVFFANLPSFTDKAGAVDAKLDAATVRHAKLI